MNRNKEKENVPVEPVQSTTLKNVEQVPFTSFENTLGSKPNRLCLENSFLHSILID